MMSVTTIFRRAPIIKLKAQAKRHLQAYDGLCAQLDCGMGLAEVISPQVLANKLEFNRIMDELAKIDPTTPKSRL